VIPAPAEAVRVVDPIKIAPGSPDHARMRSSLTRRVPIPARLLVTLGVPLLALVLVLGAQVQAARAEGAQARLGVARARVLEAMAGLQASVVQPETAVNAPPPAVVEPGAMAAQFLVRQMVDVIDAETRAAVIEIQKVLAAHPQVLHASARATIAAEIAALRPVLAGDVRAARLATLARARTAADDALTDSYLAAATDVPWSIYQGVIELNRTSLAEFTAVFSTLAGTGALSGPELSALSGQRANAVNRSRYGVDARTRDEIDTLLASPSYRTYQASGQRAAEVAAGRADTLNPFLLAPIGINALSLRDRMETISRTVMRKLLTDLQRRAAGADADRRRAFATAVAVVLLTLLLAVAALRSITVPLRRITARAGELAEGRLDGEPVAVVGSDELARLTVALEGAASTLRHVNAQAEAMAEGRLDDPSLARAAPGPLGEVMHENVAAVQASANRLRHAADHDPLTGLLNRAGLERSIDRTRGHWLLYLDLDGFKQVNDVHGHEQGDDVLRAVAERLLRTLRPDDLVSRLGGDEFAVVLAGGTVTPPDGDDPDPDGLGTLGEMQEAESAQQRIEAAVRRPVRLRTAPAAEPEHAAGDAAAAHHVQVGVSIGRARVGPGAPLESALDEADAGMYQAKRARKAGRGGAGVGLAPAAGERSV
jgi:GGDEF domain-containing protein